MKIYDTFLFGGGPGDLDLLECRLYELDPSPIYRFVIVEADRDNQGHPKPLYYADNRERFAAWNDRIIYVLVRDLPNAKDTSPWDREKAQREATRRGLRLATAEDLILHGDVDEIPTVSAINRARNVRRAVFRMRCAVFAVDWELPYHWDGTVALPFALVNSFWNMRLSRDQHMLTPLPASGWHLTWLGGSLAINRKLQTYCHTEMTPYIERGLQTDQFYGRGVFWGHGQGDVQLLSVDVDETWPKWIYERKCPPIWFRRRGEDYVDESGYG